MSRPRRAQARVTATLTVATALCLFAGSVSQAAQAAPTASAGPLAAVAAQREAAPQTAFDQQMVSLINDSRTRAGLTAVAPATGLTRLSVDWSTTMATGGTGFVLKHNPDAWTQLPSYGAASRTSWAENVASWTSGAYSAQDIFTSYMNSPGHRANIMNPAFRFVGVGTVSGSNSSDYNTMTFTDKVDSGQSTGGTTTPTPTTPAPTPTPPAATPPTPTPPAANRSPQGSWDGLALNGATATLWGWAFDPDVPTRAINADVYDRRPDGTTVGTRLTAGGSRPDVGAVFAGIGSNHGLSSTVLLPGAGTHTVCLFLIDANGGSNPLLGCRDIVVAGPVGSLDSVSNNAPGVISVAGWAADPSADKGAEETHIYVSNGATTAGHSGIMTSVARGDVAGIFPWAGPNSGFVTKVPVLGEGAQQVCVYAISAAPPAVNPQLGCSTVTVRNAFGSLDGVRVSGGSVTVWGWALNPNNPGESVQVHVYDNGPAGTDGHPGIIGNQARADIAAAFPGYGGRHGYSLTYQPQGRGQHSVCAFAITTGGGAGNSLLGCQTVTVS